MTQKVKIKKKKIKVVKTLLKPKLISNIQVFPKFANFYWRFIKSFDKIAALLIWILKIILSALFFISNANDVVVFGGSEVADRVNDSFDGGIVGGKVKNLSKIKNI